jgi:hypothetical protein
MPLGASLAANKRFDSLSKIGAAPALLRITCAPTSWLSGRDDGRGRSRASPADFFITVMAPAFPVDQRFMIA